MEPFATSLSRMGHQKSSFLNLKADSSRKVSSDLNSACNWIKDTFGLVIYNDNVHSVSTASESGKNLNQFLLRPIFSFFSILALFVRTKQFINLSSALGSFRSSLKLVVFWFLSTITLRFSINFEFELNIWSLTTTFMVCHFWNLPLPTEVFAESLSQLMKVTIFCEISLF